MAKQQKKLMIVLKEYDGASKPWMILQQDIAGIYHRAGKRYTIKGLYNFFQNEQNNDVEFESVRTENICGEELEKFEEYLDRKKREWITRLAEKFHRTQAESGKLEDLTEAHQKQKEEAFVH